MSADLADHVTIDEAFHILWPAMRPHEARHLLSTAIATDRACLLANGAKFPADWFERYLQIGAKADTTDRWTAELTMREALVDFYTTKWTMLRTQVTALLPEETKPAIGGKRGAKVKFDWHRLFAEMIYRVHTQGIPPSKSYDVLATELMEWCEGQGFKDEDIPEHSTLKKKLGIWFSLLPRE